jgi:RNA polymerase sigma-70 factor (ECF subfamily)
VATHFETDDLELELEAHRRDLTGYCYRMLGSGSEAEDAVQETLLRAWRKHDSFEGRSSLKSWLYRIATNVCLDMLQGPQRRALPMDIASPQSADAPLGTPLPEATWLMPVPDARVLPTGGDPAELAAARETIRLAFIATLQHLPPKQRAVLILREVLHWQASEVAELLGTTVASVNSALQRARSTLDAAAPEPTGTAAVEGDDGELLEKYVDAFERYDIAELVTLLHDDAVFSMPPFELWLRGRRDVHDFMLGTGGGCRGSKLIPTTANGCPAFGSYKPQPDGGYEPWALFVLELEDGGIAAIHNFLDTSIFPAFGLPTRLDA